MEENVANGVQPIQTLPNFNKCTLDSTFKLESSACIFDQTLYSISNKALGYDICESKFSNSLYIFEETFEYWNNDQSFSNNKLKSAKWLDIYNGKVNTDCGVASGKYSLSFTGTDYRYAETKDMNVYYGGKIESDLFLPPIGEQLKYFMFIYIVSVYLCIYLFTCLFFLLLLLLLLLFKNL
jgi:hypothetical protein